jgi:hypothetical protein
MKTNPIMIGIHLDGSLKDQVIQEKKEAKKTYSAIVRTALRFYFANRDNE